MTIINNIILKAENVSKVYKQDLVEIKALDNVSFEVKEGEFIVILGPSGSGKSTLLNLIGGIDTPTAGNLYIMGDKVSEYSEDKLTFLRRNKIGFVFQFFNLIPSLTALENVEFSMEIKFSHQRKDKKKNLKYNAVDLLDMIGLSERKNHFPSQLSGGEQQRVAIARSLANDPDIILCDEPTGELDYRTGRNIIALLKKLNQEENKTLIFVTHNAVIGEAADRVFNLHNGEIANIRTIEKQLDPLKLEW